MAYPFAQTQPQYFAPNLYQSYQQPIIPQAQASQPILVKGIDAAKTYPVAPMNTVILWDEDVDVFYRVSANMQGSGKPNIVESFNYSKIEEIAESKNQNEMQTIIERLDQLEKKFDEKLAYKPKYNKNRRDDNAESDV